MHDPPLHYEASTGLYHSSRRCPDLAADAKVEVFSYDEIDKRFNKCERCVPPPIFVPRAGVDVRPVYHVSLTCRSVPRRLRFPKLQYDWVWWPSWEYQHVTHAPEYRRCTKCIPDRAAVYPLGKKRWRGTRINKKARRRRRAA